MSKWLELAERCEKATGPDREIDWAIGLATGWRRDIHDGNNMIIDWEGNMFPDHYGSLLPSVTESLDVITALIERELPGWYRASGFNTQADADDILADGHFAVLAPPSEELRDPIRIAACASEALARCAAFCRAMAAKDTT